MRKESKREQNLYLLFLYFIYGIFNNSFPYNFIPDTLTASYSGNPAFVERERERES
jgi:hypothetical protein